MADDKVSIPQLDTAKVGDIFKRGGPCPDCDGTGRCGDCTGFRSYWGLRFWMWGKCVLCYGTGSEGDEEVIYVRPR